MSIQSITRPENVIPPSRRADGTLRKEVRIRPGFVGEEQKVIYKCKGVQMKELMESGKYVPGMGVLPASKPAARSTMQTNTVAKESNERTDSWDCDVVPESKEVKGKDVVEDKASKPVAKVMEPVLKNAVKEKESKKVISVPEPLVENENDSANKVRKLRKKLRQIEEIEKLVAPTSEQLAKVDQKEQLIKELASLEI